MPVGYDPQRRGLTRTSYVLDNVNGPVQSHQADFSADPWIQPAGSPAFAELYERRYGPHTFTGGRFKRWARSPGNEAKSVLRDALAWIAQTSGASFGLSGGDGKPSEREVTDVQAFADAQVWQSYLRGTTAGFRPDNRETINDPHRPPGDGQEKHFFWQITWYYHNTAQAQDPPPHDPPPHDPPPHDPPPRPDLSPPEQRAEELWSVASPVVAHVRGAVPPLSSLDPAKLWPVLKPLVVELLKAWRRR